MEPQERDRSGSQDDQPWDEEPPDEPDDASADEESGTLARREKPIKLDCYTAVDEKLQSIVQAAPTSPPWRDAWQHSTRGREFAADSNPKQQAGPEERLAVWQAVRDSGLLPEDAGFFLVARQIEFLMEVQVGEQMGEIDRRVDALWAERGFAKWRASAPCNSVDFAKFRARCPLDWDRLYLAMLRKHGAEPLAQLYQGDREHFEQQFRAGREYFYPTRPAALNRAVEVRPAWLDSLILQVHRADCFRFHESRPAKTLVQFEQQNDHVAVWWGFDRDEVFGGPDDGKFMIREFQLNIERLRAVFDDVSACSWDSHDMNSTPYTSLVWVEGTYQGHRVVFHVLSRPGGVEAAPNTEN